MTSALPRRVLFAVSGSHPITNTIAARLNEAVIEGGGEFLRVLDWRDPCDDGIPTVELREATTLDSDPAANPAELLSQIDPILTDTKWYLRVAGLQHDAQQLEHELAAAACHVDYVLNAFGPDLVLVWNGLLGIPAVVAGRARRFGVPVRYCERGPLPGTWSADPLGVNGGSSLVETPSAPGLLDALRTPLSAAQRTAVLDAIKARRDAGLSAHDQPIRRSPEQWQRELGIEPATPVLFFPMQVSADTNMRFFSPHFTDSMDALQRLSDTCRRTGDYRLLVKPHPQGTYAREQIEHLVRNVGWCVERINLYDAIELASLVVTINSTTGAEAAWLNRPVLQLGRGILSGKSIVTEYNVDRSFERQLREAEQAWNGESERFERALRFLHYLENEYLFRADRAKDPHRLWGSAGDLQRSPDNGRLRNMDAAAVAGQFIWQPAARLLDQIASRPIRPHTVVLCGFGRNARRLLQAVCGYPWLQDIEWQVWDDDENARRTAVEAGLRIARPPQASSPRLEQLYVITPREPQTIATRFVQQGWIQNEQFISLFPTPLVKATSVA